ncbi:MAG TPA: hypothetical protein VHM29_09465 [Acidimicrobiia bacterium]|nr:hypothetical protein [Acidimicrobiia bacterium]
MIAKESSRRGIARRIGAAGLALAAVVTLGACKATGGGQIDEPVPSGVLPTGDIDGAYKGDANFGFNFTCEMTAKNKAVIKGEITYHDTGTSTVEGVDFPEVRLHGVVDPVTLTAPRCEAAAELFLDAANFDGTYRSQDTSLLSKPPGRFNVLVFDQGEPGRTKDPAFVSGDGFTIELAGGPYTLYTRAGYIEGGNIQVDNT